MAKTAQNRDGRCDAKWPDVTFALLGRVGDRGAAHNVRCMIIQACHSYSSTPVSVLTGVGAGYAKKYYLTGIYLHRGNMTVCPVAGVWSHRHIQKPCVLPAQCLPGLCRGTA